MCFYPGMYTQTHKRHMCICKYIYIYVCRSDIRTYIYICMYVCEYITYEYTYFIGFNMNSTHTHIYIYIQLSISIYHPEPPLGVCVSAEMGMLCYSLLS